MICVAANGRHGEHSSQPGVGLPGEGLPSRVTLLALTGQYLDHTPEMVGEMPPSGTLAGISEGGEAVVPPSHHRPALWHYWSLRDDVSASDAKDPSPATFEVLDQGSVPALEGTSCLAPDEQPPSCNNSPRHAAAVTVADSAFLAGTQRGSVLLLRLPPGAGHPSHLALHSYAGLEFPCGSAASVDKGDKGDKGFCEGGSVVNVARHHPSGFVAAAVTSCPGEEEDMVCVWRPTLLSATGGGISSEAEGRLEAGLELEAELAMEDTVICLAWLAGAGVVPMLAVALASGD